jgi:hypothetical protein
LVLASRQRQDFTHILKTLKKRISIMLERFLFPFSYQ